jgi:carbon storage regulator CsrA
VLVLTRRPNEKIVLPGLGVTLQVLAVKGRIVRLGFEAPSDVKVVRKELLAESQASAPPTNPAGR